MLGFSSFSAGPLGATGSQGEPLRSYKVFRLRPVLIHTKDQAQVPRSLYPLQALLPLLVH